MSSLHFAALLLLAFAPAASAIVIRDDVPEGRYRVAPEEFPALADLPHEGHGVLIARQWVVTVAHAVQGTAVNEICLAGRARAVAEVILHPAYRRPDKSLESGDAAPLIAALAASDDIALIRLAEPVEDVKPVALFRGNGEEGRLARLFGAGASGDGRRGQDMQSPHRTVLRRAYNRITQAQGRWLTYRFDSGSTALPLEGMLGNGDSGGPVLIRQGGSWKLAGLASWKLAQGELADFRPGLYGQVSYQVRLSHYAAWIAEVMAARDR
ncbi:S1 family peptidase [Tahibacter harae]|uniref:Trypsin-like serine protease n=1 Tax=Tahibacter harae TaxID=2963937 RepID=A0ABT1QR03_9GAMM|nr:trypsin-like serine protease [Tahibacter harae]MCQ4164722.1 trypsin-like serine protease [Tahibacter harae]